MMSVSTPGTNWPFVPQALMTLTRSVTLTWPSPFVSPVQVGPPPLPVAITVMTICISGKPIAAVVVGVATPQSAASR